MDRDIAIGRLPLPYAIALRLQGAGVSDTQLAVGLGIEVQAIPTLLNIAEEKLAELLGGDGDIPRT